MSTNLRRFLIGFGACAFFGEMAILFWGVITADGMVLSDGINPVGGDFVNLWTVGRMVAEGKIADIYVPDAFQHYQLNLVGVPIGFRLWAYPPHSLALALPFGLLPYLPSLLLWSLLGICMLVLGARAVGLGALESLILVLSPATALCIYYGQTGNFVAGLTLIALAAPKRGRVWAVLAAALLTLKPQWGFLLPFAWAAGRRWQLIAATTALILIIAAATIFWFGIDLWRQYLSEIPSALSFFERHGKGPFQWMVPSIFMSARILTGNGDIAIVIHALFAVIIFAAAIALIFMSRDEHQRWALTLLATALITPYLHIYDLGLVLAGVLIMTNSTAMDDTVTAPWRERAILLAWALPYLTILFNRFNFPISPLILLVLLLFAADTLLPRGFRLSRADRV